MNKITRNIHTSISYGHYSLQQLKYNTTMLKALNEICKEASKQNKEIMYAKLTVTNRDNILLTNKSL